MMDSVSVRRDRASFIRCWPSATAVASCWSPASVGWLLGEADGLSVPATSSRPRVSGASATDRAAATSVGNELPIDRGRRGRIQRATGEAVLDLAVVEQRGEQQRLVEGVAGARLKRASGTPQDARIGFVPDVVGHVPEETLSTS